MPVPETFPFIFSPSTSFTYTFPFSFLKPWNNTTPYTVQVVFADIPTVKVVFDDPIWPNG